MGVHGLTSYLKAHRHALSRTLHLSPPPSPAPLAPEDRQQVIIDGWSLLYAVYRTSALAWVYGGEYALFEGEVRALVAAWRGVGLEPVVVFDGPTPAAKFPTVESRLEQTRKNLLLTYRSGPAGRLGQAGVFVLPPLCYSACLSALTTPPASPSPASTTSPFQPVQVHFADGEGDGFTVELARQRAAWIFATDSDFVVYIGSVFGESGTGAEGMGYCPLDEMVWVAAELDPAEPTTPSASSASAFGDEEDFRPVKRRRQRHGTRSTGLLPPPHASGALSLSLTFYPPLALSTQLNIPPTHLPLLASFLGTDFTPRSMGQHFHPSATAAAQNVVRTATALRTAASAQTSSAASGAQTPSGYNKALDLIMRVVDLLALRPPLASGLALQLREAVISSTLQYALPPPATPSASCPLHPPEACDLPAQLVPSAFDDWPLAETKPLLLAAYRGGGLAPELLDPIATGTMWPSVFLEDPDEESAAVWVGREVRGWVYALLQESVGVWEEPVEDDDEDEDDEDDEDEDEAVADDGESHDTLLDEDLEWDSNDSDDELIPVRDLDSDEEPAWVAADKRASTSSHAAASSEAKAAARARARAKAKRETELYHGFLPEHGVAQPDNSPELRSLHAALWRLRGEEGGLGSGSGTGTGTGVSSAGVGGSALESGGASMLASPPPGALALKRVTVAEYVRRAQRIQRERVEVRAVRPGDLLPADWRWVDGDAGGEVGLGMNGHAKRAAGTGMRVHVHVPLVLRSERDRVRVLLYALRAEGTGILDVSLSVDGDWDEELDPDPGLGQGAKAGLGLGLGPEEVHLALAARWAVVRAFEKSEQGGGGSGGSGSGRRGESLRWRKAEMRALAGVVFSSTSTASSANHGKPAEDILPAAVPLENRPIALTSQLLHALENIAWLAQALLLPHLCGGGETRFGGRAFHAALLGLGSTGTAAGDGARTQLSERAERWCALVGEGLGSEVWLGEKKRERKERKGKGAPGTGTAARPGLPLPRANTNANAARNARGGSFGMFGALEGLPAE